MPLPGRKLYYERLAVQDDESRTLPRREQPQPRVELALPLRSSYAMGISKSATAGGRGDAAAGVSAPQLYAALKAEYPHRYLERVLGLQPRHALVEQVLRVLPLAQQNVRPQLRLRGALADEAVIRPPELQAPPPFFSPLPCYL